MRKVLVSIRESWIFCHRWMGVAFCLLFSWWFFSGIVMMYWDFPGVGQSDRLERSPAIDAAKTRISPREAWVSAGAGPVPRGSCTAMLMDGACIASRRAAEDGVGGEVPDSNPCLCG